MTAGRILSVAWVAYAVHVAVLVVSEFVTAGEIGPPIDDGWIYMAFARSLAEGEGITYPGHEGPLCAVTGPIWNALLAVVFLGFGATAAAAKALGVAVGAFALWAVYRLGQSATADARLGAIAALVLALSPRFVWGALSVMEVPFFIATVGWGIALHLDRCHGSLARWLPALFVLWLAGWARPECFVFPVIAALHRRGWRELATLAALLALYPIYHLTAYGHPLPTTFYAKASGGAPWSILGREGVVPAMKAAVLGPFEQLADFVGYLPTYLPFLALGTLPGVVRGIRERTGIRFVTVALLLFVFARGALGVHVPGFQYGRYYGHVVAMFVVVSLYGFDFTKVSWRPAVVVAVMVGTLLAWFPVQSAAYLFDWIAAEAPAPDGSSPVLVRTAETLLFVAPIVGGAVVLVGFALGRFGRPPLWLCAAYLAPAIALGAIRHGRNVHDTFTMNVAMAKVIAEKVPEGAQVACHDIGAIGFFSNRRVLDLAGLGSPEVVFGPRTEAGRIDGQRIFSEARPRYVCLTGAMLDAILGGEQLEAAGLVSWTLLHQIDHPENITLLGTTYWLAELAWQ